jgi:hypothetical protein
MSKGYNDGLARAAQEIARLASYIGLDCPNMEPFERFKTSDDIRFGCLAYGVRVKVEETNAGT